ncbi:MAG: hypothetical protein WCQ10_07130 [Chitinophagia bacterium]
MPPRMNFENQDYLEAESEESHTDDEDNFNEDYDDEYLPADSNKCYLALCELYNGKIHGSNNKFINSQYLVLQRFTKRDLFEETLTGIISKYSREYRKLASQPNTCHSIIRNYKNIISRDNYISPQIVKCSYLPEGECVAVIKTIWIKLIQRKWKTIFSERQRIIGERSHINSIFYRELHGTWPCGLNVLPGICGMLSQMRG